jgi:hypothetical protein
MFILEDGATLRNVIIGPGQAEGVHCKGTCTLENVWFEDVCEDAITLKQKSGTSIIRGGGAFHASDKVVQFNGRGTVEISDFYVEDYGKLVRACGNCKDNGGPRNVVIENIAAVDGGVLCGSKLPLSFCEKASQLTCLQSTPTTATPAPSATLARTLARPAISSRVTLMALSPPSSAAAPTAPPARPIPSPRPARWLLGSSEMMGFESVLIPSVYNIQALSGVKQ